MLHYIKLCFNNVPVNKRPTEQKRKDTHAKIPIIVEIRRMEEILFDKRVAASKSLRAIIRRNSEIL
jgi:hypothetical protein